MNIKDRARAEKEPYKNGEEDIFEDLMVINPNVGRSK